MTTPPILALMWLHGRAYMSLGPLLCCVVGGMAAVGDCAAKMPQKSSEYRRPHVGVIYGLDLCLFRISCVPEASKLTHTSTRNSPAEQDVQIICSYRVQHGRLCDPRVYLVCSEHPRFGNVLSESSGSTQDRWRAPVNSETCTCDEARRRPSVAPVRSD